MVALAFSRYPVYTRRGTELGMGMSMYMSLLFYTMHWKGGREGTRRSLLRAHTVRDAGRELEKKGVRVMG